MHSILWGVFEQIRDGKLPENDQCWTDLISGYDCISRAVHPTNVISDYLNSAMWFWGAPEKKEPLKAFQLVWPGYGSGLFPWEDDCPQIVRDTQPALYLPHRSLS